MIRLSRGGRAGLYTDVALIGVLLFLAVVYFQRRSYPSSTEQVQGTLNVKQSLDEAQHLIDSRIKKMPDLRSTECKSINYKVKDKVTVIIDFFDYDFYDVRYVVSALLKNTDDNHLEEIILVDDGSTLQHIQQESSEYAQKLPRCRMLKIPSKTGSAKARMSALTSVQTEIVVFIDKSVLVGHGWLEPLIHVLTNHPESIVTPHFDYISEPVSYDLRATSDKLATTFSWRLTLRATDAKTEKTSEGLYNSPVLRGNIFAVRKSYFLKIGGYDPEFLDAGGVNLELSLRAWLCGGPIFIVPCSRVGVLNLYDPVTTSSAQNIRRISEIWFPKQKDYVYRTTMIERSLTDSEKVSIDKARAASQTCKDIDWYLNDVVHEEIAIPSNRAKYFGLLRCKTMQCAHLGKDGRIDLGTCSPNRYGVHSSDSIFEYDEDGFIKVKGKCLATKDSAYVVGEDCREGDVRQHFTITDAHALKNTWSGFCLMHVTDPDKNFEGKRQIAMAQDCASDSSASGNFIAWEFVPI